MFGEVLGQHGGNVRLVYRTPEWVGLREGFIVSELPGRQHAVRLSPSGRFSVSVAGCAAEPVQEVFGCGKVGSYEVYATNNGETCSATGLVNLVEGLVLRIEYPNPKRQNSEITPLECTPSPRPRKNKAQVRRR